MSKEKKLVRLDGMGNFETLEDAILHLKLAYSDILGNYTYEGFKGEKLIKKTNEKVKESCNEALEEILGKGYGGEDK